MALPQSVLLKSNANNKYLCYTKEKANDAFLRFSYQVNDWKAKNKATAAEAAKSTCDAEQQDNISLPYLKFEVDKSKTVDGLVHIRSCYNNKYFVRRSVDNNYIAAAANEPDEDQSKWSCTLFKPIFLDTNVDDDAFPLCKAHKIQLLHVCESGQRSVRTSTALDGDGESVSYLAVGDVVTPEEATSGLVTSDSALSFTAIDVDASAILPEYATFMGYNDKYATSTDDTFPGLAYIFRFSASDIGQSGVAQRVPATVLPQPTFIIDKESGKSWFRDQQTSGILLWGSSKATTFVPIKVGNYTALKCMENDRFITGDENDTLYVTATGITEKAMLRVGEPVRLREITEATYDLADYRIYNVSSVEKYSDTRSNYTDIEQEGTFQIKYTTELSSTWNNSTTVNIGIKVSWSAGIPVIGTFGIDISYDHSQTWAWGEEVKDGTEITYSQTIKIPAMKKVTFKVVAMKAFCDVPFTCKVTDLMTDGQVREYTKTDGLYSGCNNYDFNSEIIPEDLDPQT